MEGTCVVSRTCECWAVFRTMAIGGSFLCPDCDERVVPIEAGRWRRKCRLRAEYADAARRFTEEQAMSGLKDMNI